MFSEGVPYQLIGGELIIRPTPTPYHQRISRRIEFLLIQYVEGNNLGEVFDSPIDVYFEQTETYQPDVIFISKERLDIIKETRLEGAPDLVIEILSPGTAYYDLRKKFKIYEKYRVKEYWIIDPEEKNIEVYVNKGNRFYLIQNVKSGIAKSEVLKGFQIEIEKIFQFTINNAKGK